ncbi:MAG: creatininase family protein [Candidatus Thorarchaeota archaeon]|jgi:creatinine amidohydrolase
MPEWIELTHGHFLEASQRTQVAVMITGALEAHGTHLPLGTDSILPTYLGEKVAQKTNALVLPVIPFGDSWSFEMFKGTVSVSPTTLQNFYTDVMEGVFRYGFRFIVALNGHGGNSKHIEQAARRATMKGERVVIVVNWWRDMAKSAREIVLETPEGHGAEDETSEVIHVRPDLVDDSFPKPARVRSRYKIVSAAYREELYPSALYGDPSKAHAEKGRLIMEEAEDELIQLINQLEKGELPFTVEKES